MIILPVNNKIMNSVTYVLYTENIDYCVLIDCGEYEALQSTLEKIGKKAKAVLLTHGHLDHIYGLKDLLKDEPSLIIGTNDEGHKELGNSRKNLSFYHEMPFTVEGYNPLILSDKQILHFEGLADIEVIATLGHSPSCITYKIGQNLFTGDAYIPGVKIFTSFPRGNKKQSLESIALLSEMEGQGFYIYCGHHSYLND